MPLRTLFEHYLGRGAKLVELSALEPAGELKRPSFSAVLELPPDFSVTPDQRGFENSAASAVDISIQLRNGTYIIAVVARQNPQVVVEAYDFLQSSFQTPNS